MQSRENWILEEYFLLADDSCPWELGDHVNKENTGMRGPFVNRRSSEAICSDISVHFSKLNIRLSPHVTFLIFSALRGEFSEQSWNAKSHPVSTSCADKSAWLEVKKETAEQLLYSHFHCNWRKKMEFYSHFAEGFVGLSKVEEHLFVFDTWWKTLYKQFYRKQNP